MSGSTPPTVYAADSFTRSASSSWGSADVGGAYSLAAPASDYNVTGSAGTITSQAAGDLLRAVLSGVFVREVNVSVRLWADKAPTADQFAYVDVRRVDAADYYQLQVRFATDGHAYIKLRRIIANVATDLGFEQQVTGYVTGAAAPLWVRAQATGINPTSLSIRAWPNGQAEPATWQFTTTDSNATLQVAAPVGLRTSIPSATNLPITFSFDNFSVADTSTTHADGEYHQLYVRSKLYRLSSATNPSGTTCYGYDPLGNRLSKVLNGTSTSGPSTPSRCGQPPVRSTFYIDPSFGSLDQVFRSSWPYGQVV